MTNIAALPWYDFPSTRPVLDAVWVETRSALAKRGIDGLPITLSHSVGLDQLVADPDLVVSQCCGLELFQARTSNVIPLAVPNITVLDVPAGYYFSHIVTRKDAALDCPRVVINSRCSHSGHAAIRYWLAANSRRDFTLRESGSHAQSVLALQSGEADLAAIDALSWRHLDTTGLVILDRSDPAPAPPFIVGRQSTIPKAEFTQALDAAFARCGRELGITGVLNYRSEPYERMVKRAAQQGVFTADIEGGERGFV